MRLRFTPQGCQSCQLEGAWTLRILRAQLPYQQLAAALYTPTLFKPIMRVSNHNIQYVSIFTFLHCSQLSYLPTSRWAHQSRERSPSRPRSLCQPGGREKFLAAGFYYSSLVLSALKGLPHSFSPKSLLLYWLEVSGHRSSAVSLGSWLTGIALDCKWQAVPEPQPSPLRRGGRSGQEPSKAALETAHHALSPSFLTPTALASPKRPIFYLDE